MNKLIAIILIVGFASISGILIHQSYGLLGLTSQGIMQFHLQGADCNFLFYGFADAICSTTPSDLPDGQQSIVSIAGTVQNLYVEVSYPTNGNFTIYVNNSPTALKCSISGTDTCHDTTHGIAVNPGDTVMLFEQLDLGLNAGTATIIEMT